DIHPDHWEFRNFRGSHNGGEFYSQGGSTRTDQGNHLAIEITGKKILLDSELEAALVNSRRSKAPGRKLVPRGGWTLWPTWMSCRVRRGRTSPSPSRLWAPPCTRSSSLAILPTSGEQSSTAITRFAYTS